MLDGTDKRDYSQMLPLGYRNDIRTRIGYCRTTCFGNYPNRISVYKRGDKMFDLFRFRMSVESEKREFVDIYILVAFFQETACGTYVLDNEKSYLAYNGDIIFRNNIFNSSFTQRYRD